MKNQLYLFVLLLLLVFVGNVKCENDDNDTGASTTSQEINNYLKSFKFMVLMGLVLLTCVAIVIYIVLYCKIKEEKSLRNLQNEWVTNKKAMQQQHLLSDTDDQEDDNNNTNRSNIEISIQYDNNNNNNNNSIHSDDKLIDI
ncbi:hypothetical protein CYY_003687 [Polysphondylium violaceum]|uniref:Uncharacterized protein n=1 Tax=Polysphondylium violaceum TaxID=133409 RepID=A0A8J4PWK4_9MYCE|nr:hypothetical protein CYY_003687 [Polysphondylium violaceum]